MADLRNIPAIRTEAERLARDYYLAEGGHTLDWDSWIDGVERQRRTKAHLDLICDLTRPASRDAVARLVVVAMGGRVDDGAVLHRSWRGYYEMWALWPNERGIFTFRSIELVPWADIKEADPRFSPLWVKPAPYLSDGSVERKAVADPAEALRLIALHVLGADRVDAALVRS